MKASKSFSAASLKATSSGYVEPIILIKWVGIIDINTRGKRENPCDESVSFSVGAERARVELVYVETVSATTGTDWQIHGVRILQEVFNEGEVLGR